eukprot:TRINITY_DN3158_c0_g1_i5.p1 TRINITY_DN3158_c0_g1~~TRINITY_DN3158_c0_g1_i5.p1  ORF type:complete len:280 (-),score=37.92 TRINITY_DN3158_c0_g1_i5:4-843(-)
MQTPCPEPVVGNKSFHPVMFVLPYSSVERAKVLLDFVFEKDHYYMYKMEVADYTMREFSIGWWKLPENIWEQEIPLVNADEQLVEPTNVALSALRISLPQKIKATLWPAPARDMGFDPGYADRDLEAHKYYPPFVLNFLGFLGFIPFFFFTFGYAALLGPDIPELSQVGSVSRRHLYRSCFHAMRYAMWLYSPFYSIFSSIFRWVYTALFYLLVAIVYVTFMFPIFFAIPVILLLLLFAFCGVFKLLMGITYPLYVVWARYAYQIHADVIQKRVAVLGK